MASFEEDWEFERGRFLDPRYQQTATARHRARSVGHSPAPNVQVYNYTAARNESHSPPYRGRSPARLRDDELLDEMADLRRDVRRELSRGRSPAAVLRDPSPSYYQNWQLEHIQRDANDRLMWERDQNHRRMELQRLRDRISREEEESRIKGAEEQLRWKVESERLKAEAKAQAERIEQDEMKIRIIREKDAADRKAKEERERAVKDWEQKHDEEEKERKETERRAVEAYHRRLREEKEKEEEMKLKFRLQEEKEKAEEKERERQWELKQREKKEKEEREKKEKEAAIEAEMHKRLSKFGFQENQIEAMMDPKKAEQLKAGQSPSTALVLGHQKPTYIKIHTDHISVETLKYYHIPYEFDRHDPKYIIIMQEMSNAETDILFEHTRRLRKPTQLFIEDRGDKNDPKYAWVRKPARSKSRSRARSPALFGPL